MHGQFNGPLELLKNTPLDFSNQYSEACFSKNIYISLSSENPFNQTDQFNFITEFSKGKGAYGPNCERKDSLNPKI